MEIENDFTASLGARVTNHVSALLAYWDKDLICRFANAAYMDWFGKSQEDMINKISIKELLGPIYEKNLPYITGALNGELQAFERAIQTPSGAIKHSLTNYYPDVTDGEVKGFFVHVADVTPLKLLQKELVKSNKIIGDQNKRLLNFSNIVSHNLKSYSNNLEVILDLFITAESDEERNEMLGYLKSISKGFSSTVNHLNQIVKAQNQSKINSEHINLREYIQEALDTLRIQLEANHAVVKNNVSQEVRLMVNPAYMESILLNFLTNSIKYRHPDRAPVIELSSYYEGQKTVLVIQDNGVGIDLEKHGADLFGMYKTFHDHPDAQGIGLFITKYQIETMGGEIKVDSAVGEGTTFTIFFNSAL
jgi:PAS domain S-box-containing protein